jgi:hypothetical protein
MFLLLEEVKELPSSNLPAIFGSYETTDSREFHPGI